MTQNELLSASSEYHERILEKINKIDELLDKIEFPGLLNIAKRQPEEETNAEIS